MNIIDLKNKATAIGRKIKNRWYDRTEEPPELPVVRSELGQMVYQLTHCPEVGYGAVGGFESVPVDGFNMDEIREIIARELPHKIAARFTVLVGPDVATDPLENCLNINAVAFAMMFVERYMQNFNPRVQRLRRACDARARMAEHALFRAREVA